MPCTTDWSSVDPSNYCSSVLIKTRKTITSYIITKDSMPLKDFLLCQYLGWTINNYFCDILGVCTHSETPIKYQALQSTPVHLAFTGSELACVESINCSKIPFLSPKWWLSATKTPWNDRIKALNCLMLVVLCGKTKATDI